MTQQKATAVNGTGAETPPLSEDALDDMIADSFPASDPPSFTPVTHVGAKTPVEQPSRGGGTKMLLGVGAAVVAVVGAIFFGRRMVKKRRAQHRNRAMAFATNLPHALPHGIPHTMPELPDALQHPRATVAKKMASRAA